MSKSTDVLLEANSLTRRLSPNAGVFDLSLCLKRGDVLGLLGLNGAGKSTTLRLLSGLLTPDSGEVRIAGYSLSEQPMLARANLGYLPDQPPLYNDMRVKEYLHLCAKLRQVPKTSIMQSIDHTLLQCDLQAVASQRIAKLSKGYRQRVGLAQALVHSPKVLLLDEPSNGLDPQQMLGMRHIIKTVAEQQSVVFSTHLLNEAQSVCNRVALVNDGRIVHESQVLANNDDLETLFTGLTKTGSASTLTQNESV